MLRSGFIVRLNPVWAGAPFVALDASLVSSADRQALSEWNEANSLSSSEPIADCATVRGVPFNLTLVIGGVAFDVSPVDLMDKFAPPHGPWMGAELATSWCDRLAPPPLFNNVRPCVRSSPVQTMSAR